MSVVTTEVLENISVITIDNPPVNALSHAVRDGLSNAFKEASNDHNIKAILLKCSGRTFCAGADISEFGKTPVSPTLPELMDEMDLVRIPIIAALHGTALGGGFELALCCHYRVMNNDAKVGLPEVNLGLIPGAGGTQRLPRLIGVKGALDMISGGKPVSAYQSEKLGIVDMVSTGDLCKEATDFTINIIRNDGPVRRISEMEITASANDFNDYKKVIAKKNKGFLAPNVALDAVKAATEMSFRDGIEFERERFIELLNGSQSKAQRHLFFAERAATKVSEINKNTPSREIRSVAVIGGGLMGCGIAINFLNRLLPVCILEVSENAAKAAKEKIETIYNQSVLKGRISEEQKEKSLSLLNVTTEYNDLSDMDLIIEAAFEDMGVKKQIFSKLDKVVNKDAILATNTSFLDINEIAASSSRPENVIGLHFFSPAHIMPLLEIVRTEKNSPEVIATALKAGKIIGKKSVVSGVCHGFIANRMSSCYGREAGLMLLEGATVEQIDKALYDFGMPMGMFSMLDMAGIDIGVMVREKLDVGAYDERAFSVHAALVKSGQKGKKTGSGFYIYDGDQKKENPDVDIYAGEFAKKFAIKRRELTSKEIEERCIIALINEGYKIVEEGIAYRTSDVDVVYAYAFGFPKYKGGPLHYAEQMGLNYIVEKIKKYAEYHGERWWTPSNLLVKLAIERN